MSTQKCAPCPARSTFGDHANAQCFERSTCATPAAAAERSIEPMLPGSCTSSTSRQKSAKRSCGGRGVATTANTPTLAGTDAVAANNAAGTTSVRCEWRSATSRTAGVASASSATISVSALPCRRRYAETTCSPSSTHLPVLRRSRDDAISAAASRRRGFWREVTCCTGLPLDAVLARAPRRAQRRLALALIRGTADRPYRQRGRACRGRTGRFAGRLAAHFIRPLPQLEEHFVLLHHAELGAGALFDRLGARLQVAHVGVERIVSRLELRVRFLLGGPLPVE